MEYRPLRFEQYFIDNSEDYNSTGKARRQILYKNVKYKCGWWENLLGFHHECDYEMYYEEERDVIQINFQKSNGRADWFANVAEFSSKYYDSIDYAGRKLQLRVHHGWAEMYKCIKKEIRTAWLELRTKHPDAHTEIIGWSLGSGQAILCAQDLNFNFGCRPYLYTFGSVRPFRYTMNNRVLTERYLSEICTVCYNFANTNDIVTYMPPFYGFTMPKRVNIGDEKKSLWKLLDPNYYHVIYDEEKLYRKEYAKLNRQNRDDKKKHETM